LAGKLCLIKSVILSLPLYYLYIFKAPKVFVRRLLICKETFCGRRVLKRVRLLTLVEKKYVRLRKKVG